MSFSVLEGKTICVIGASGKFGKLASEGIVKAGGKVVAVVRNRKKYEDIMSQGVVSNSVIKVCDCFNEDELSSLYIELKDYKIDGMINCLSYRPMTKFFDDDIENWNQSVLKNSASMFSTTRYFARKMSEKGGGSIVLVSSIYGIVGPDFEIYEGEKFETEPDYPFIKGGMVNYCKYLASYMRNTGVRVNCLAAGGLLANQPNSFIKKYSSKTLMGRMANDEDISGPMVFLLSDMSSYVTGTTLTADGGWTAK